MMVLLENINKIQINHKLTFLIFNIKQKIKQMLPQEHALEPQTRLQIIKP